MKKLLIAFIFSINVLCIYAQGSRHSEEVRNALLNGARVKMTVKVVDEEGMPVSNATTRAYFRKSFGREWGKTLEGKTDGEGIFIAEERTSDTIFISADKEGYYKGLSQYFATKGYKLDGDKWLPWDVTNTVVIRSIRKPVAMYKTSPIVRFPKMLDTSELGYDFMIGDWVKPYGNGEVADVVAKFELLAGNETKNFSLHFVGDKNGYYTRPMFTNSYFRSEYEASTKEVYLTEMKGFGNLMLLNKDEYCVIRIRSKVDKDGNLISAYYGKIYAPFQYPSKRNGFSYKLYMNLDENERSLEFDGAGMAEDGLFYR